MPTIHQVMGATLLISSSIIQAQEVSNAEVRLSYADFKQLIDQSKRPIPKSTPKPELLSARLKLDIESQKPVIHGHFKVVSFSDEISTTRLIGGNITLEQQDPDSAWVLMKQDALCLATQQVGTQTLKLRLLPQVTDRSSSFEIPPCPSVIFEVGQLPESHSVVLQYNDLEFTLASQQSIPLPNTGGVITLRLLDDQQTQQAQRPAEPSTWTWQNQAMVEPCDGDLIYQVITHASANEGSGVHATLAMPADARDIQITSDDLTSHEIIRGQNRALSIDLRWNTRGILDRKLVIRYLMPLRPLDPTWHLQAPGDDPTRTRFIIPENPLLAMAADGLSPVSSPQGLAKAITAALQGRNYRYLKSKSTADLTVTNIPVTPTADGVIRQVEWVLSMEPDGAMLITGVMTIEHPSALNFEFDTPPGMKLLSCEMGDKTISPIDRGAGRMMLSLPDNTQKSQISCSFTGRSDALDPVEGTMKLSLPKTPLFIHSLLWTLNLPSGYQAETHGNLQRISHSDRSKPNGIALRKSLCRDERPEVQVFYQRSDLNR